jgi:hypothetical protein
MQDDIDRHHILPRWQFPAAIRASADNVANIAFITSEVNRAISHTGPEVYLEGVKSALLESQCIPVDPAVWRIRQAEAFFAARRDLLADSFNEFAESRFGGESFRPRSFAAFRFTATKLAHRLSAFTSGTGVGRIARHRRSRTRNPG